MNIQSLREKREEILQIATKHGAKTVRIFGSVARGEADAASDLDFLVEMEPGRSLLDLGGLLMELQDLFGMSRGCRDGKGAQGKDSRPSAKRSRGTMRDDTQWLLDIIEAIDRIERYSSRGRDVFERDELVQNWIVNHLQLIGEAARSLSSDLREANKEVPWAKILGRDTFWFIAISR